MKLLNKGLILAISAIFGWYMYNRTGLSQDLSIRFNDKTCSPILPRIACPEDQASVDESTTIISSSNVEQILFSDSGEVSPAGFYLIKKVDDKLEASKLEVEGFPEALMLNPHGIDFWDGRLFAVNHPMASGRGDTIEVFDFDGRKLIHRTTIFFGPQTNVVFNDIAELTRGRLFISMFQRAYPLEGRHHQSWYDWLLDQFQVFLPFPMMNVVECQLTSEEKLVDGNDICKVRPEMRGQMPNGITTDRKNRVFLADLLAKEVNFYQINAEEVIYGGTIPTQVNVDNISYDPSLNRIHLAGSLRLIDVPKMSQQANKKKTRFVEGEFPSAVEYIDLNSKPIKIETLVRGIIGTGVTGAGRLGNKLLVNHLYDTLYVCDYPSLPTLSQFF